MWSQQHLDLSTWIHNIWTDYKKNTFIFQLQVSSTDDFSTVTKQHAQFFSQVCLLSSYWPHTCLYSAIKNWGTIGKNITFLSRGEKRTLIHRLIRFTKIIQYVLFCNRMKLNPETQEYKFGRDLADSISRCIRHHYFLLPQLVNAEKSNCLGLCCCQHVREWEVKGMLRVTRELSQQFRTTKHICYWDQNYQQVSIKSRFLFPRHHLFSITAILIFC